MIREVNKVKRLAWALENQEDDFDNVIWSDECTIQLENHRRFCGRKVGHAPKPKPKYASYNVHVLLTLVYALIMYIQHVHVVLTEYYDTHFIYLDQNIL